MDIKLSVRFDIVQKEQFVHNVVLGLTPMKAVTAMGITRSVDSAVKSLMHDTYVLELLQAYKDEILERTRIDRDKLTLMAMDTFDVAQVQGDSRGMIQVVKELADLHGMHTPQEIKVINSTAVGAKAVDVVARMDDAALLKLVGPLEDSVLEAEFTVLESK